MGGIRDEETAPMTGEGSMETAATLAESPSTRAESPPARRAAVANPATPAGEAPTGIGGHLGPGTLIGRYMILDHIGSGGMGSVYKAYDHELDRRIALKLVRPWTSDRAWAAEARSRLLREAKALARLQHPNVIAVHDAGQLGGAVFIAMELVEGKTLRAWLADEPRERQEILDVFVAAGRGLAAAHAAGLIHRDFKPDNVIVGDDGRVRVLDFGLARAASDPVGGAAGGDPDARDDAATHDEMRSVEAQGTDSPLPALTRAGTILGTPRYMAPEQHRGEEADARTDLFCYCVSLFEALYGAPPFAGGDREAVARAVEKGEIAPAPEDSDVPTWLRQVVVGGLAVRRELRPASMNALLAALTHDPVVVRRRRLAIAGGAVAFVAVSALAIAGVTRRAAAPTPCAGAARKLEGVWDPPRRAAVAAAFAATGKATASELAGRTIDALDAWAERWTGAQTEACEATRVHGEQSVQLLDLRTACLDRRLGRLDALVELFVRPPDKQVLDEALEAALALPDVASCGDAEALTAAVPPPADPAVRARVDALDRELDRAAALEAAGRYAEGLAIVSGVADESARVGHAPLRAAALFLLGLLQKRTGDGVAAERTFTQVLVPAAEAHDDQLAARVWIALIDVVGRVQGRHEDALALRISAEAAVARISDPESALQRADMITTIATVLEDKGDLAEARDLAQEAFAIREQRLGPDHLQVAASLSALGGILNRLGKFDEALVSYERALAVRERALGPNHPDVAIEVSNVAAVANRLGDTPRAIELSRRAIAIKEVALGPEHPSLAVTLVNLGVQLTDQGKADEAIPVIERSLAIREKVLAPGHHEIGSALHALGSAHFRAGHGEAAIAAWERALAIREAALGADHSSVGQTLVNLGIVYASVGRTTEALRAEERALAIHEKKLGPDHINVAVVLVNLADLHRGARDPRGALPLLERAYAITAKSLGEDHPMIASILAAKGQNLVDAGRRREAIAPLERAQAMITAAGDPSEISDEIAAALARAREP